jgi:hypothetical protein
MGFRYPAKIEFDRMDLSNEDAEKALLIQLADRNLISDELLQTRFGFDPDMEKSRLNREARERDSERMVKKSGPWHDPQFENSLKKISLQLGITTPSQVGLDLEKKKPGEKTAIEMKMPGMLPPTKLANDPSSDSLPKEAGEGRPRLSKDGQKRKQKEFKPRTGAKLAMWAINAQDKISNIINPVFLEFCNKKNLRTLSSVEAEELEVLKTNILLNLQPFCKINEDNLTASFDVDSNASSITKNYYNWLKLLKSDIGRDLTMEENKQAKASYYSLVYDSLNT